MDSRQHDFPIPAGHQYRNFMDHARPQQTPASSAHRRNDAERTIGVAAILHLHDRARSSTRAEMRLRLQLVFKKDIAAEDFRTAGWFRIENLQRELAKKSLLMYSNCGAR